MKMGMPYRVSVIRKGEDLYAEVNPQPIPTDEKYLPVITKTFSRVLTKQYKGIFGASMLKTALIQELTKFHESGLIKPKED